MKKIYLILFSIIAIISGYTVKAQTVYADVAPIFYSRCTSCHHEHQHAPSMMNYSETVSNSTLMLSDLTAGKMPPWPPDTAYTRFNHEHIITASEKSAILNWLNHGATMGDTTLAPVPPVYPQYQLNGTPDLILKIPTFTSNASTSDAYNCFSIPTNLTQNRILRAFEIVPGNAPIVHHVVIDVDSTGTDASDLSGGCFATPSNCYTLGFYVPGAAPTVYPGQSPLKAGVIIKAGSNFRLQIHYPSGTAGQLDSTQIRLYFYPIGTTGVRPIYTTVPMQNWNMNIAANTTATYTANYVLPADVSLFGVGPHSHKVCTAITQFAFHTIDTIPLIRIKDWNFSWQGFYSFPKLLKIPTGYKILTSHFYDNTTANPNNPFSPPQTVTAGTSTTNEMLFDGVQYLIYQAGDENIDVASLLDNDPLLTTTVGISEIPSDFHWYVYPNPASDKINIYLSKSSEYKISIYTITGQNILQTKTSDNFTVIDTKNIAEGLYILEIMDTKSAEKITKKIVISH